MAPALTVYGQRDAARRTSLVAFNLAGRDPVSLAEALNRAVAESRAGCHCATLGHHALRLDPPASSIARRAHRRQVSNLQAGDGTGSSGRPEVSGPGNHASNRQASAS